MAAYRYAGFWRRTLAACLDVAMVASLVTCGLLSWSGLTGHTDTWSAPATPALLVTVSIIAFISGLLLDSLMRGTPGKLLMACHVVDADTGKRIGMARALLRGLAMGLSLLLLGLGFARIAWDRKKQGLHDRLARTLVVIDDEGLLSLDELAGNTG